MRSCVYFPSSILGWIAIRLGRGVDSTNAYYFATQVIAQPILQLGFNKATINHKEINNLFFLFHCSMDQFWFLDIVSLPPLLLPPPTALLLLHHPPQNLLNLCQNIITSQKDKQHWKNVFKNNIAQLQALQS